MDFHDHRYGGRIGLPADSVKAPVRACEEKLSAQTNLHTVSGGLDSTLQIVAETNFNIQNDRLSNRSGDGFYDAVVIRVYRRWIRSA